MISFKNKKRESAEISNKLVKNGVRKTLREVCLLEMQGGRGWGF